MRLIGCEIEGYRSLKHTIVPLDGVTVLVGENGAGKTSIVRALELVQAASQGRICRMIAEEGGLRSVAWAGRGDGAGGTPLRVVRLTIRLDALAYRIQIGEPRAGDIALDGEPVVQEERLVHVVTGPNGTIEKTVMHRDGATVRLLDAHGRRQLYEQHLLPSETALFAFRDAAHYPELALLRQLLDEWRIYHRFPLDTAAPARRSSLALCAPALAPDADDLASALATVILIKGRAELIREPLREAFPGADIDVAVEAGRARFRLHLPDMERPLAAHELSEGMLQYVCLIAALSSYRAPGIVAINEPESGLQPSLHAPLARLVARAAAHSQIIVVTHSRELVDALRTAASARVVEVSKQDGVTILDGRAPPAPSEITGQSAKAPKAPAVNEPAGDPSASEPSPEPTPATEFRKEGHVPPPIPVVAPPPLAASRPGGPTAVAEMAAQRDEMRRLESARETLHEIRAMLGEVRQHPLAWPQLYPQLQERLARLRQANDILPVEMTALTDTLDSEIRALAPPG